MNTIEAWSKVSLSIKNDSRISDASRRAYIKTLVPLKEENNILYLMAPSLTNKKTVEVKYYDIIREHIQLVTGKDYIIKIINNDKTQIEPPKLRIVSKNSVISSYRFDNFIVGSSNQLAHAASYAVAKSPGKDYNPLFLYGGVGLGKTHLMNAIANYILEKNPESKIAYITCENFVNELVKALKENENEKFREKYRKLDVLLIDDIQFITGKAGTQEEFFHTFNSLYNENKQIIIASDRPPDEIKNLTIRLSSRFTSGLMADINPPDIETRIAILKQKSEEQNFHIDDDVIYYIAENVTSNVRELVGALTKVKAYKLLINNPIDLTTAKEALSYIKKDSEPADISIKKIQDCVCGVCGISIDELTGKKRTKPLSTYRQIAEYLCRKYVKHITLVEIAKQFGGQNHTSVKTAVEKIHKILEENSNKEISELVSTIEAKLNIQNG